jgi:hypothetical protein
MLSANPLILACYCIEESEAVGGAPPRRVVPALPDRERTIQSEPETDYVDVIGSLRPAHADIGDEPEEI